MVVPSHLTKCLLGFGLLVAALPAVAQERAMVPVAIEGETVQIATITYKPAGAGPFPTLIFHHGSTGSGRDQVLFERSYDFKTLARWFTDRGWAVILPSRRGRGGSDGLYDEGFAADRSQGYSCEPALALAGAERALRDLDALTPVLLAQPFVDRERVAIGGHSRGGVLAVAWSGRRPEVARAVVNFVGGWVSERCPSADNINQDLSRRGGDFDRPMLWLYGYKDPLYSLRHSWKNFSAFRAAGGQGAFRDYVPPEGLSGHQIDSAPELWTEALEAYLTERGLPAKPAPSSAQAIDGNTLKMGGAIYRLWGIDAPELDQRCYPEGWRAGIEAARALAAMVERWPVTCEARGLDSHGRTVALCRVAGRDLGAAMVLAGMALAVSDGSDGYVDLESRAMQARAGIHAHACLAPREWRAQRGHDN
jgi:endonuclease YncB( thermonuclease family)/dienelactone hydrolase